MKKAILLLLLVTACAADREEDDWRNTPRDLCDEDWRQDPRDAMAYMDDDDEGLDLNKLVDTYKKQAWEWIKMAGIEKELDTINGLAKIMTNKIKFLKKYDKITTQMVLGSLLAGAAYGGMAIQVMLTLGLLVLQCPVLATASGITTLTALVVKGRTCAKNMNMVRESSGGVMWTGFALMCVIGAMMHFEVVDQRTMVMAGLGAMFILLLGTTGHMMTHSNGAVVMPVVATGIVLVAMALMINTPNLGDAITEMRYGVLASGATPEQKKEYTYYKGIQSLLQGLGVEVTIGEIASKPKGESLKSMIGDKPTGGYGAFGTATATPTANMSYHPVAWAQRGTYGYGVWTSIVGSVVLGYCYAIRALQKEAAVAKFYTTARGAFAKDKKGEAPITDDIVDKAMRELGWKQVYSSMAMMDKGRLVSIVEMFAYGWLIDGPSMGALMVIAYTVGFVLIGPQVWVRVVGRAWLLSGKAARDDADLALMIDVTVTGCTDPQAEARSVLLWAPMVCMGFLCVGALNSGFGWIMAVASVAVVACCTQGMTKEDCNVYVNLALVIACGHYSALLGLVSEMKGTKTDYWLRTKKPMRAIH